MHPDSVEIRCQTAERQGRIYNDVGLGLVNGYGLRRHRYGVSARGRAERHDHSTAMCVAPNTHPTLDRRGGQFRRLDHRLKMSVWSIVEKARNARGRPACSRGG